MEVSTNNIDGVENKVDPVVEPKKVDFFASSIEMGGPEEVMKYITAEDDISMHDRDFYRDTYSHMYETDAEFNIAYDGAKNHLDLIKENQHLAKNFSSYSKNYIGSERYGIGRDMVLSGHHYQAPDLTMSDYAVFPTAERKLRKSAYDTACEQGYYIDAETGVHIPMDKAPSFSGGFESRWTVGYETDEEGKQVSTTPVLKKYQNDVPLDPAEQVVSIWGGQNLDSNGIVDGIFGFLSSATVDFLGAVTSTGEAILGYIARNTGMDEEEWYQILDKELDRTVDFFDRARYQPGEKISQEGMFSSWGGFAYNLGVGLGNLVPQRAGAAIAAKMFTKNRAMLQYISSAIGTIQAVDPFYRAGLAAGLGEDQSFLLSLAASPAVFATEWALKSKWLTSGLGEDGKQVLHQTLKEEIENTIGKYGSKALTQGGMFNAVKNGLNAVRNNPVTKGVFNTKYLRGSVGEGFQEGMEESWYAGLERFYDTMFADPNASVQNGKFGTVWGPDLINRLGESFAGGMIIGGIADFGIGKHQDNKEFLKQRMVAEYGKEQVLAWGLDGYNKGLFGSQETDPSGSAFTTEQLEGEIPVYQESNQPIPGLTGEDGVTNIRTMNDFNYSNFVQEINNIDQIIQTSGINNPEVVNAIRGNEDLMMSALQVSKTINIFKEEKAKLEAEEKQDQKKIAELDKNIALAEEELNQIVTPEEDGLSRRYKDIFLLSQINATSINDEKVDSKIYYLPEMQSILEYDPESRMVIADLAATRQSISDQKKEIIKNNVKAINDTLKSFEIDKIFDPKSAMDAFGAINKSINEIIKVGGDNVAIALKSSERGTDIMEKSLEAVDDIIKTMFSDVPEFSAGILYGDNAIKTLTDTVGSTDLSDFQQALYKDGATRDKFIEDLSNTFKVLSGLSKSTSQAEKLDDGYTKEDDIKAIDEFFNTIIAEDGDGNKIVLDHARKRLKYINEQIDNISDPLVAKELSIIQEGIKRKLDTLRLYKVTRQVNEEQKYNPGYIKETTLDEENYIAEAGNELTNEQIDQQIKELEELDTGWKEGDQTFIGFDDILTRLNENAKKREFRENNKRRGKLKHHAQSLNKFITIDINSTNPLLTNELKLATDQYLKKIENVRNKELINDDQLVELEKEKIQLFQKFYNEINKDDKKKEGFIETVRLEIIAEARQIQINDGHFSTPNKTKVGETLPVSYSTGKDNTAVRNDDLINQDIDNLTNLIGQADKIFKLPKDKIGAAKASLLSSWILKQMNTLNLISMYPPQDAYVAMQKAKEQADSDSRKLYLPSSEQEDALMLAMAIFNSNDRFTTFKNKAYKDEDLAGAGNGTIKHMTIEGLLIQAIGGGGKTTIMTRMILNMINEKARESGKKPRILFVGTDGNNSKLLSEQAKGLNNIETENITITDFFGKGVKSDSSAVADANYDLVILDEASRLNRFNLINITDNFKDKNTKFLFLADPNQSTNGDSNFSTIQVQRYTARTEMITEVFRSGNTDITKIQLAIGDSILGYGKSGISLPPNVFHNATNTRGVKYFKTEQGVIDEWISDVNSKDDWKERKLIVTDDKVRARLAEKLASKVNNSEMLKNIIYIDYDPSVEQPEGVSSAQGREFPFVYVAIPLSEINSEKRILNTAVGRPSSFLSMVSPEPSIEVEDSKITEDNPETAIPEMQEALANRLASITSDMESTGKVTTTKKQPPKKTTPSKKNAPKWKFHQRSSMNTVGKKLGISKGMVIHDNENNETLTIADVRKGKRNDQLDTSQYIIAVDESGNEVYIPTDHYGTLNGGRKQYNEKNYTEILEEVKSKEEQEVDDLLNDVEPQEEVDIANRNIHAIKTATDAFLKSSGTSYPISFGIVTADHESDYMFSRAHTDSINEVLKTKNLKTYFYNEIELWTPTQDGRYEKKTHYNVIAIGYKTKGKVTVVGTLYQPSNNANEVGSAKSLNKNTDYTKNGEWSGKLIDVNRMMNSLSDLYLHGQKKFSEKKGNQQYIEIGSFKMGNVTGGTVIVDASNPQTFKEFVDEHRERGMVFRGRGGVTTTNMDEILIHQLDRDKKRVQQNEDGTISKYVTLYAYVSYTGVNWKRIELKGIKINENPGELKKISDNTAKIIKSHFAFPMSPDSKLKAKTSGDLFLSDFFHGKLMQTIFFNRSLIVKNGTLLAPFAKYLEISTSTYGKINITPKMGKGPESERMRTAVSNAEKAFELIKDSAYSNIAKTAEKDATILTPNESLRNKMKTVVKEVHLPQATGKINIPGISSRKNNPTGITGHAKRSVNNIDFDGSELSIGSVHSPSFTGREESLEYLEDIFGKTFIQSNFRFSPHRKLADNDYFGIVMNKMMELSEFSGKGILKGVARHEAVHFALNYFVDPQSRFDILDSTKIQMRADGVAYGVITDDQAEEYLAEVNRGAKQFKNDLKENTSLIKQFINWLSDVLFNVKAFGSTASKFLYNLNKGKFRNNSIAYNNKTTPSRMDKYNSIEEWGEAEGYTDVDPEDVAEDNSYDKSNGYSRGQLTKMFGSSYILKQLEIQVMRELKDNSVYSRDMENTSVDDLVTVATKLAEDIDDDVPSLIQKYKGVGFHDVPANERKDYTRSLLGQKDIYFSLVNLIMPQMNMTSEVIDNLIKTNWDNPEATASHRSLAALAKFHLQTIKVYEYLLVDGTIKKTNPSSIGNMNFSVINEILYKTSLTNPTASQTQRGITNRIDTWFDNLRAEGMRYASETNQSETTNAIFSFLEEFAPIDPDIDIQEELDNNQDQLTYYSLATKPVELLSHYSEIVEESELETWYSSSKGQYLMAKSKASQQLINALASHYYSIGQESVSFVGLSYLGKNKEKTFRRQVRNPNNKSEIKNLYKQGFEWKWYNADTYKSDILNEVDPENDKRQYIIDKNGIKLKATKTKLFDYKGIPGSGVYVLGPKMTEAEIKKNIKNVLSFLSFNIDQRAVDAIMDEETDTDITKDEFIDLLGTMMATIQSAHDKANHIDELKKIVSSYVAHMPIDGFFDVEEAVNADAITNFEEGSNEQKAISFMLDNASGIKLNDFFDPLNKIAAIEAHYNAVRGRDMTWTMKGNKYHMINVSTPITRKMINSDDLPNKFAQIKDFTHWFEKENASNVLFRDFQDHLNSMTLADKKRSPRVYQSKDKKWRSTVPLENIDSGLDIVSVENSMGVGTNNFGQDVKNMNTNDYINSTIFGYYFTSLIRSGPEQVLHFTASNPADSSKLLIYATRFGLNKNQNLIEPIKNKAGKIVDFKVNNETINRLLDPRFEAFYKQMSESLNKWTNVTVDSATPFSFTDSTDVKKLLSENDFEKTGAAIKTLTEKVNQIVPTNEIKQALSNAGLIENKDWIINEKGQLDIGSATRMDHDIFSLDNYRYWQESRSLSVEDRSYVRNAMFSTRFKNMNQYFLDNKISLPTLITDSWKKEKKTGDRRNWMYPVKNPDNTLESFDFSDGKILKFNWNPVMEAFYYGHFIVSDNISQVFFGNEFQAKDAKTQSKYNKKVAAQGTIPTIDDVNGTPYLTLGKTYQTVKIIDEVSSGTTFKNIFGLDHEYEGTDGLKIMTGMSWNFYTESFGGDVGNIRPYETTGKTLGLGVDHTSGDGRLSKSAILVLNDDIHTHNPKLFDSLMKYLLTANQGTAETVNGEEINLYEKYKEFLDEYKSPRNAQVALKDYVVKVRVVYGIDLVENTASMIEYKSTNKIDSGNQNYMTLTDLLEKIETGETSDVLQSTVNTEDELNILNANQDKNINTTTRMSQAQDLLGIGAQNHERINEINMVEKTLIERNYADNAGEISEMGFQAWVRKVGQSAVENRTDVNRLISLFQNPAISIQLPAIRGSVMPEVMNRFNKGARNKVAGRKMVQMPGDDYILYYDVVDQFGNEFTATEEDVINDPSLTMLSEEPRRMNFIQFHDESGNNIDDIIAKKDPQRYESMKDLQKQSKDLYRDLVAEKKKATIDEEKIATLTLELNTLNKQIAEERKKYNPLIKRIIPAEIAMAFPYFREFGINELDRPSLNKISTLHLTDENGGESSINLNAIAKKLTDKGFSKSEVKKQIEDTISVAWDRIDFNRSYIFSTDNDFRDIVEIRNNYQQKVSVLDSNTSMEPDVKEEQLKALEQEYLIASQKALEQLSEYYTQFMSALDVMAARIPGTAPGSGFIGRITSFTYDSNSTIYTSAEKSLLDNSDYDIDQLTVTFKGFERHGALVDEYGIHLADGDGVELDQMTVDQLNNRRFQLMYDYYKDIQNIDLLTIPVALDEARVRADDVDDTFKYFTNDFTTTAKLHTASHEGGDLIAYFANAIRNYSKLSQLSKPDQKKYLPGFKFNPDGTAYSQNELEDRVTFIISTLGELAQITVDNPKELIMGLLNINNVSANMITAMALSNYSKNDLYEFVSNPAVKAIVTDVLISQSTGTKTKELYVEVEKAIKHFERIKSVKNIEDSFDNMIQNKKNYIEVLKKKSGEILGDIALGGLSTPSEESAVDEHGNMITSYEMYELKKNTTSQLEADQKEFDDIELKIKTVEADIQKLLSNKDKWISDSSAKFDQTLNTLVQMYDLVAKGEAIRRIGIPFALNQGMKVKDYEFQKQMEDLEYITLRSLDKITRKQNNETNYSYQDLVLESYGKGLIGYKNRSAKHRMIYSTQKKLDTFADKVITELNTLLNNDVDFSDGTKQINLVSDGQSGFGEAFAKSKVGTWNKTIVMPKHYRFRKANRKTVYQHDSLPEKPSTSRFPDAKIIVNESKSVFKVNSDIIGNSQVVIDFNATRDNLSSHKLKKAKDKYVNIGGDLLDPSNAKAIAKTIFNKISSAKADEGFINVVFGGNDLAELNNPSITEYESWLKFEKAVRSFANITGLINTLPNIKAMVRQVSDIDKMFADNFFVYSDEYKELVKSFLDTQEMGRVTFKSHAYALQDAFYGSAASMYMQRHGMYDIDLSTRGQYGRLKADQYTSQLAIKNIDLRTTTGQDYFLDEFPRFIMDLISENDQLLENAFLKSLTIMNGNLVVRGILETNQNDIDRLRSDFKKIDKYYPELQKMFSQYNMIRNAYSYKITGFADFIPDSLIEQPSQFINEFTEQLRLGAAGDPKYVDLWNDMKTNWIHNAMQANPKLVLYRTKDDKANGITPLYNKKVKPLYVPGTDIVRARFETLQILDEDTNDYVDFNNKISGRTSLLPVQTDIGTKLEVFKQIDTNNKRQLLDKGSTVISYPYYHSYTNTKKSDPLTYGIAMGKIVSIEKLGQSSVRITLVEAADYAKVVEAAKPSLDTDASEVLNVPTRTISKKGFYKFINRITKINPNIDIRVVNNRTTEEPGKKAYRIGNTLYYNEDRITADTPIHELGHLFMIMTQNTPSERFIYDSIIDDAQSEIDRNTELYKAIKAKYPGYSGEKLLQEIGATKLGFASEPKVYEYINPNKSLLERLTSWAKNMWSELRYVFTSLFNYNTPATYIPSQISQLGPDSNINDIANALTEDALNGYGMIFTDDDLESIQRIRPDKDASKELDTKIKNVKGLEDALLLGDGIEDVDSLKNSGLINGIYSDLDLAKIKEVKVYDVTVKFEKEFKITDNDEREQAIKKKIRLKILPVYKKHSKKFEDNVVGWLNHTGEGGQGSLSTEVLEKFFTIPKSDKLYFSHKEMKNFRDHLGYIEGNLVLRASQASDYRASMPELAEAFDNADLKGNDPLIIIHGVTETEDGKRDYDISLFDLTAIPLRFNGKGINGDYITTNFEADRYAEKAGVTMAATLYNARNLVLGYQVMNLTDSIGSTGVNLRKAGIIQITRSGRNSKINFRPVNMDETLNVFSYLSKNESFMKKMPSDMFDLLSKESIYDKSKYFRNYIQMMLSYSQDYYDLLKRINKKTNSTLERYIQQAEEFIQGNGTPESLLKAIRERQKFLEATYKLNTAEAKAQHQEYVYISAAAYQLTSSIKNGIKKDINWIQFMTNTQYNLTHEILQNYTAIERNTFAEVNGKVLSYLEGYNKELKILNKIYYDRNPSAKFTDLFADSTSHKYERIFIKGTENGQEYKTMRLHWDEKDQRTIDALNNPDLKKRLSREELKIGQITAAKIDEFVKMIMRQHIVMTDNEIYDKEGKIDTEALNEKVDKLYNQNWEKGMVPVMTKSTGESLFDKQYKNAFDKIFNKIRNPNLVYEDIVELTALSGSPDHVDSMFRQQFVNSEDKKFGGRTRMEMMGFEHADDKTFLSNIDKNNLLTMNLNTIMRYLAMDAYSYPAINNKVLPALSDARIMAKMFEVAEGEGSQENVLKYLQVRSDKTLRGKHQKTITDKHPELQGVSSLVRTALTVTSFSGVALSVPVAITSLTANTVESITVALANSFANPYKIFDLQSWAKAQVEYIKNPKKAEKILQMYQVIESDRWDILGHSRYDPLQKHWFTREKAHGMNRWTDITMRSIAAVSQMIYDGTWNAHSLDKDGNGVYNPLLDKRFNTDEGKELKKWIREELLKDDRYAEQQKDDLNPVVAYDLGDQRKLQMVGTEFVTGVFEQDGTAMGNNYLAYSVITQFKRFMEAKLNERLGKRTKSLERGYKNVYKDEMGALMREMVTPDKEGSWVTLFDNTVLPLGLSIADKVGIGEIVGSMRLLNLVVENPKSLTEASQVWSTLANRLTRGTVGIDYGEYYDLEVHNIIKAMMDILWITTGYVLYAGISGLADDEDKKFAKKNDRALRAWQNGWMTAASLGPKDMMELVTNWPLVGQMERIMKIFTWEQPMKQLTYLVPGGGTGRVVADQFSE